MHLAGFRKSNCTTGKSRICVMRKLPVVPLCRRPAVLLETPNQKHLSRVPPPQEGRIAIVTDVGSGMRWTLRCRETGALKRTAKACGPDAPTLASRSRVHPANEGGKRARSPGRARDKLLKPLRGECRMFPVPPL